MGAGSGHLALACAYQARAEGLLVNEHPDPNAYIDDIILGTLKRTLGVPNKSHLFVVAERTPHRHHSEGGVHGLVDYVASVIAQWPQRQAQSNHYPMTLATKATILGHTLRGAPPTPEDKAIGQHLAFETVQRLRMWWAVWWRIGNEGSLKTSRCMPSRQNSSIGTCLPGCTAASREEWDKQRAFRLLPEPTARRPLSPIAAIVD
jgi:hypothetical protein